MKLKERKINLKKKKRVREICKMPIRFKSAKKRPEKMEEKSKERLVI